MEGALKKVKVAFSDENYKYLSEIATNEGWTISGLVNRAIEAARS